MTNEIIPTIYSRDRHNISRKQIDPDALKILYRLMRHGFRAYLVGGGVRDLLLGIPPKDYDIGTDARPRQIKTIFRNSRIIGRRFKLVHVYFHGGKIIEVATFRAQESDIEPVEEGASDSNGENGTLNENIYGSDATDAFRRDLTINGLFYDLATFSVIDYVGGMQDLEDRLIRVIGEPDKRFAEDPVRLIRVLRHAGRIGFSIEDQTYNSLVRNRELIKDASDVRVYEEIKKDLTSGHSAAIMKLMLETGLLECFLPELVENNGEFFEVNSHAGEIFSRADAIVKNGYGLTSTAVLAAITAFIGLPSIDRCDLPERFTSKQDVTLHLQGCFHSLSVPRKERERIQLMLFAWLELVHSDPSALKVQRYRNKEFLPDLIGLIRLVGEREIDHAILEALSDLEKDNDTDDHHVSRGNRRRTRGRTRGRRRFM